MDYNQVKEFIGIIDASGFALCELSLDNCHIKLSKTGVGFGEAASVAPAAVAAAVTTSRAAAATAPIIPQAVQTPITILPEEVPPKVEGNVVTSPIVGTFYLSAGPDKPSFKNVGDSVKKGDILCIVEAMKVMNEITSEFDGTLAEIIAKNEAMVEYGAPLFRIV
ncbi:MAG: acetyl-CoA carboxylase biotin carboxyl carrier protein [Defluviitaleaceae bacterium]|nr:acetyl-CoA carboxylase biotin carboxyl carrier protein [Defluviitaleaceae bacterium]